MSTSWEVVRDRCGRYVRIMVSRGFTAGSADPSARDSWHLRIAGARNSYQYANLPQANPTNSCVFPRLMFSFGLRKWNALARLTVNHSGNTAPELGSRHGNLCGSEAVPNCMAFFPILLMLSSHEFRGSGKELLAGAPSPTRTNYGAETRTISSGGFLVLRCGEKPPNRAARV
jgi:hypothetical protein